MPTFLQRGHVNCTTENAVVVEILNGKYLVGQIIGVGGMGQIHAAEEIATGRTVAIKRLHPRLVANPAMVTRLIEEADATRRVSHPNVVRVLDHGVAVDGAPFLVMERVRGTPLGVLLRTLGPMEHLRIIGIASQLLAGLHAIHATGLAHGDIKSDNILVEPQANDRVTIIDLGVARALADGSRHDGSHLLTGTPEYLAPEVIRGAPPSISSDLYGVGVILYEMVTATTPYGGGSAVDILSRHISEDLVPPSARYPEARIPPEFDHEICRALEKTPECRPTSAEAFIAALRLALPPTYEHATSSHDPKTTTTFSTSGKTADWVIPTLKPTAKWHRPR